MQRSKGREAKKVFVPRLRRDSAVELTVDCILARIIPPSAVNGGGHQHGHGNLGKYSERHVIQSTTPPIESRRQIDKVAAGGSSSDLELAPVAGGQDVTGCDLAAA